MPSGFQRAWPTGRQGRCSHRALAWTQRRKWQEGMVTCKFDACWTGTQPRSQMVQSHGSRCIDLRYQSTAAHLLVSLPIGQHRLHEQTPNPSLKGSRCLPTSRCSALRWSGRFMAPDDRVISPPAAAPEPPNDRHARRSSDCKCRSSPVDGAQSVWALRGGAQFQKFRDGFE
jgi:hypothetical protein